ncbi:Uma2 family endonuclease [Tumidithrix elongata RA019]|uniref:Uma2 family endonuclease n=1 Tax=Tumidithrix elongata BACA0141 TaxID=2716417 RepID=A0AAW9Q1E7_9CYAN|nr:Uma2 family endonuclease [Tumidithrix elongata RA019]
MVAQPKYSDRRMSPEDYLAWEAQQDIKYEYERGKIIAMTGGTLPHSQVPANFAALLVPHLRGKGCKVFVSDAKVMTGLGVYYYPDVAVTCDERDRNARDFLQYPSLIVESLSPTTEARDRGIKLQNYLRIETLQEYVLIDPDRPSFECYRRSQSPNWEYHSIEIEGTDFSLNDPTVYLASVSLEFPLSFLYENIDFPMEIPETAG